MITQLNKVELSLIVITSHDIEQTCKFYRAIGLDFKKEKHNSGPEHYAAPFGATVIEIYPCKKNQKPADCLFGFTVNSIGVVLEKIEAVGGRLVVGPKQEDGKLTATIEDPDGRTVHLYENKESMRLSKL